MFSSIASALEALDIPPRVARAYTVLARRGELRPRDIVQELSISRASAHDVARALVKYGFARMTGAGRDQMLVMESPQVLREAFEIERKKADRRAQAFEALLPSLTALHAYGSATAGVRYFAGFEGLQMLQHEFAELPGDIVQILDYDTFLALESHRSIHAHRAMIIERKKRVQSILLTSKQVYAPQSDVYELRCVPRECVAAAGEMSVCEDRVLLLSYAGEMTALEIRSQALADVCRAAFVLAWKGAETFLETQKQTTAL